MPVPIIVMGLLGQAVVQVATKPWPWIVIGAWVIAAKVDFGLLREEVMQTVSKSWWMVVTIILLLILKNYIKLRNRGIGNG